MFDLSAVQAALREDGLERLAIVRFSRFERAGTSGVAFPLGCSCDTTLVLLYPGPRRAEEACASRIEPRQLDAYPGTKAIYLRWQELEANVASLCPGPNAWWRWSKQYV
jgi:hypothetical protein